MKDTNLLLYFDKKSVVENEIHATKKKKVILFNISIVLT